MTRYVVKVRRVYQDREATSVLCPPTNLHEAEKILRTRYAEPYQSDQYYIEEWKEQS